MSQERLAGTSPAGFRSSRDFLFLAILFLGYLAFTADRTVLSAVLKPLSSSLGAGQVSLLGVSGVAWLASAQFIGVLAFVLLSGSLSDRYGQRGVILLGVGVFTAFTWLVGLATSLQEAFAFRLVSGFGEGLFWPAAMSAVANYYGANKGLALGIFYAGFDIGGAAGNTVGSAAFALTSDWRSAFFVAPFLGVPVVVGALASRGTFRSAASRVGRLSLGREAFDVLRARRLSVILGFAFLATWASVWQVAYLPYYYATELGASVPVAGLIAAGVLLAGMAGKVALGRVSDSFRRDRLLVALSLIVVGCYAAFFSTGDFMAGVLLALAMGFFSSAVFPVMQALAADASQGRTGTALGLTTTSQSVAAVLGTLLPGSLLALGVGKALAVDAMIPAVLMVGVAVFLSDSRRMPASELGSKP